MEKQGNPCPEHDCTACPCSRYAKMDLASEFPLVSPAVVKLLPVEVTQGLPQEITDASWLSCKVSGETGRLHFGCLICSELLKEKEKDIIASFGITRIAQFKQYRFQAHAESAAHLGAVQRLLHPGGEVASADSGAPTLQQYGALLSWVRKGGSLRDGVPSVGHFWKCRQMVFTAAEAARRQYRKWLRESTSISLLRDERKSRVLIRFRCSDQNGVRHLGMLGRPKLTKGTASKLNEVTKQALRRFCTTNFAAPNRKPETAETCDESLYEHVRLHVHALTVDSASNEVAAGEAASSAESRAAHDVGQAFMPNLTVIVRDKAHGSRRVLERPWLADDYLRSVADGLISQPSSFAQLIQHSDDLRRIYTECCEKSATRHVSTTFQNLRAAKHRFESMTTPLSRVCLDWESFYVVLGRMAVERPRERAGLFSTAMLQSINEEFMLQASLLADAADEAQILIRFFDEREADNGRISVECRRFVDRINQLFVGEQAWDVEGHARICLQFLETAHHFTVGGVTRTVGGPRSCSSAVKRLTMQRMQAWTRLAQRVVEAEHPCFELISNFSIFNLSEWADDGMSSMRPAQAESCMRLCSTFQVEHDAFLAEFRDIGRMAYAFHKSKECENLDAWVWALRSTSSKAARMRHPCDHLSTVLARYSSMTSSDSILERDFSRLQQLLNCHRLAADEAADVWRELYPAARTREVPRFDKHVRRPCSKRKAEGGGKPTEQEWVQKRRRAVGDLPQSLRNDVDVASLEDAGIWTSKHDAELSFQNQKQLRRLFEALHSNTVQRPEVPEQVYDMYLKRYADKAKNMKDREAAELRLARTTRQTCPSEESLQGLSVWVRGSDRSAPLDSACDRRRWTLTVHLSEAEVIVTSQPSCLPDSVLLAAGLNGAWVLTPTTVLRNEGFALKFKPQPSTKRKVYISTLAQQEHPICTGIVRAKASVRWVLLPDMEQFAVAKQAALNQNMGPSVVALIGDTEAASFEGVPHVYSLRGFLEFFCRIDPESSCGLLAA
ncbi:unnamed protein product [Symbiodinium sp. KB8]|nr:unnamed protein product [Symbiodinium sp. KB8]